MIGVQLLYRRPDGTTSGGVLITEGLVRVFSVRRYDSAGGEMLPVAFTVAIGATVSVDPGTWGFELIKVPDGRGGYLTGSNALTYRTVPNSGGPYQIDDLDEVTPAGNGLPASPEWQAQIDALQAQLNGLVVSGGGIPAPVDTVFTDATTFGRARLKDVDAAAARAALGAGTSSLVIGTTTGTAGDGAVLAAKLNSASPTATGTASFVNVTASGTVSIPDAALAQAKVSGLATSFAAKADLSGGFITHAQGEVAVPLDAWCTSDTMITRPTTRTDRRVIWHKATAPAGGGYPNAEPRDSWVVWDG